MIKGVKIKGSEKSFFKNVAYNITIQLLCVGTVHNERGCHSYQ